MNRLLARLPKRHPLAIAMWDFSWLERRWPGAGYEDWAEALDGLKQRGYDAVRIDAFPHLVAEDPAADWELQVHWTTQDWGSPALNRVQIIPALAEFIDACTEREISVALSSWFRRDADDLRMRIRSPQDMARIWTKTLAALGERTQRLLYVDLCNEWPLHHWAPYFQGGCEIGDWPRPESLEWMRKSVELVREVFPDLPLSYSFLNQSKNASEVDLSFLDFLELHIWMVQANNHEFYNTIGYAYELTDTKGYENVQRMAEKTYREKAPYWKRLLVDYIHQVGGVNGQHQLPLVTTECWGIVDYKDWPLLDWGWVKELCALGTETACATGQWAAIATSNFCGPQFKGMWRDVTWHQRLTKMIRESKLPVM